MYGYGHNYDFRQNTKKNHISFRVAVKESKQLVSNSNSSSNIYLLNPSYDINFCEIAPKIFTISTLNGSSHFNIEMLEDTSIISSIILSRPDCLEYHLDIKDENNVLQKIADMYQGKTISIIIADVPVYNQILEELCIKNSPVIDTTDFKLHKKEKKIEIDKSNFFEFLKDTAPRTFTIITNRKEYKCNIFGIQASKVINELFSENPKVTEYVYDYDDEFDEFQSICDLFNFQTIKLSSINMNSFKNICEELKIECVINDVNKFIEKFNQISDFIDEQQETIDLIDNLFDLLYHINEKTVMTVKNSIVDSIWTKSEDDVKELAAFILQAIEGDILLHPNLIELIIQLDKESSENKHLKILIPFLIKKLLKKFGQSQCNCSFIYNLYKKGIVTKETIRAEIETFISTQINKSTGSHSYYEYYTSTKNGYQSNYVYNWFFPEIVDDASQSLVLKKKYQNYDESFFENYLTNIDKYVEMLANGEPDDELTKALRHDDVDLLQDLVNKRKINILNAFVPFNIFENFVENGQTNLLNYAAAYGSLKCFKYLLLNHVKLNQFSFEYAIHGGNIEIIKIIDQRSNEIVVEKKSYSWGTRSNNEYSKGFKDVYLTIKRHQNDLFDWIIEQKYSNYNKLKHSLTDLVYNSLSNGNVHSFITLIDNGFNEISSCEIIQLSAKKGFYRLTKFIMEITLKIMSIDKLKKNKFFASGIESYASFDNLSIFKLIIDYIGPHVLNSILVYLVENDIIDIIRFYFDFVEEQQNNKYFLDISLCAKSFEVSVKKRTDDIFNYLFEKLKSNFRHTFKMINWCDKILPEACKASKFNIVKTIYEEVFPKHDEHTIFPVKIDKSEFTKSFYEAATVGSFEICKYLTDNNAPIYYEFFSSNQNNITSLASMKKDIVSIIFEKLKNKSKILEKLIIPAIKKGNSELVDYLFNKKAPSQDTLIEAVKSNNLEIVNIILKYNSEPSFINYRSRDGTALFIAAQEDCIDIFKRLISIPKINPSLYNKNGITPLQVALQNKSVDIIKAVLDFYGDDILHYPYEIANMVNKVLGFYIKASDYKNNETTFGKAYSYYGCHHKEMKKKDEIESVANNKIKDIILRILEIKDFDPNAIVDKSTFLIEACIKNDVDIVKALLKLPKIDPNMYYPSNGYTPLIISINNNNNCEIAELLLNHPKIDFGAKDYFGKTAFSYSIENEKYEMIDMMMKNDKFVSSEIDNINNTFYNSTSNILKHLIVSKFIDVNYKPQNAEQSKLQKVVNDEDYQTIDLIINHPSFDKEKSNFKDVLYYSIKEKPVIFDTLMQIIKDDINDYQYKDGDLYTIALKFKKPSALEALLSHPNFKLLNHDIKEECLNVFNFEVDMSMTIQLLKSFYKYDRNHDKVIDLNKLLPNGKTVFTSIHVSYPQIGEFVDLLLECGADPNIPDKNDVYPLENAFFLRSISFATSLVKSNKIDFNKKIPNKVLNEFDGQQRVKYTTYLHLAARLSDVCFLNLLINVPGIDINITDDSGETPLMEACKYSNEKNVKLLFQRDDLDYLKVNNNNMNALQMVRGSALFNVQKMDRTEFKDNLILFTSYNNNPWNAGRLRVNNAFYNQTPKWTDTKNPFKDENNHFEKGKIDKNGFTFFMSEKFKENEKITPFSGFKTNVFNNEKTNTETSTTVWKKSTNNELSLSPSKSINPFATSNPFSSVDSDKSEESKSLFSQSAENPFAKLSTPVGWGKPNSSKISNLHHQTTNPFSLVDSNKSDENKLDENKSDENKLNENKLDENKLDENKLDENKSDENELDENKSLFSQSSENPFAKLSTPVGWGKPNSSKISNLHHQTTNPFSSDDSNKSDENKSDENKLDENKSLFSQSNENPFAKLSTPVGWGKPNSSKISNLHHQTTNPFSSDDSNKSDENELDENKSLFSQSNENPFAKLSTPVGWGKPNSSKISNLLHQTTNPFSSDDSNKSDENKSDENKLDENKSLFSQSNENPFAKLSTPVGWGKPNSSKISNLLHQTTNPFSSDDSNKSDENELDENKSLFSQSNENPFAKLSTPVGWGKPNSSKISNLHHQTTNPFSLVDSNKSDENESSIPFGWIKSGASNPPESDSKQITNSPSSIDSNKSNESKTEICTQQLSTQTNESIILTSQPGWNNIDAGKDGNDSAISDENKSSISHNLLLAQSNTNSIKSKPEVEDMNSHQLSSTSNSSTERKADVPHQINMDYQNVNSMDEPSKTSSDSFIKRKTAMRKPFEPNQICEFNPKTLSPFSQNSFNASNEESQSLFSQNAFNTSNEESQSPFSQNAFNANNTETQSPFSKNAFNTNNTETQSPFSQNAFNTNNTESQSPFSQNAFNTNNTETQSPFSQNAFNTNNTETQSPFSQNAFNANNTESQSPFSQNAFNTNNTETQSPFSQNAFNANNTESQSPFSQNAFNANNTESQSPFSQNAFNTNNTETQSPFSQNAFNTNNTETQSPFSQNAFNTNNTETQSPFSQNAFNTNNTETQSPFSQNAFNANNTESQSPFSQNSVNGNNNSSFMQSEIPSTSFQDQSESSHQSESDGEDQEANENMHEQDGSKKSPKAHSGRRKRKIRKRKEDDMNEFDDQNSINFGQPLFYADSINYQPQIYGQPFAYDQNFAAQQQQQLIQMMQMCSDAQTQFDMQVRYQDNFLNSMQTANNHQRKKKRSHK